ncbi:radical SAM protein [Clostridium sp. ZBS4]|uniref:radical SAM protein n=1 Tax=Clostridium sp. ZBS4 TaxID=2949974 RepID=UPI002079AE33|nr:radical SAM protein [Clostridium sp. ZBS4]
MKIGVIIQAQLELNPNLRNKELFEKINGTTILEHTLNQALKCNVDKVIVFSSKGNIECENLSLIKSENIKVYKNNGKNFLEQFKNIAKEQGLDVIVRIIGNNPLILSEIVDKSVKEHIENKYEYSYYKGFPVGIRPSEIISIESLDNICLENMPQEYARYISTSLLNNDKINSNCFKVEEEYFNYSKVDFSFLNSKINKIKNVLELGVSFENIKKIFRAVPSTIRHIEITNICNIHCIMCSRSGELSENIKACKGYMKLANFKTIINKFEHIDELTLLGGEPLLHPEIKEIIKYCREKEIKVNLITNGIILNRDLSEFLIKNIHSIRFSIDGPNKEIYELIRRGSDFDKLIKNIKEFIDIYNKSKDKRIKKIGVNSVYMNQNYEYMKDVVILTKSLNIEELSFNPYCNPSFITDEKILEEFNIEDFDKLDSIFEELRIEAKNLNMNVKIDEYDSSWIHNWNQCEYIESFYITWDGYITPCCAIDRKEMYNFGNILENDIDSLYNSDKWYNFRNCLICNDAHEVCKKNCYYYYKNSIKNKV